MHELSITRSIVAICSERAMGAQVRRVTVEVGKLSAVMPESLKFCFDVCTRGTLLEGARLDIVETPGRARCNACGDEVELARPAGRCACGSADLRLIGGEELNIREMEVA